MIVYLDHLLSFDILPISILASQFRMCCLSVMLALCFSALVCHLNWLFIEMKKLIFSIEFLLFLCYHYSFFECSEGNLVFSTVPRLFFVALFFSFRITA